MNKEEIWKFLKDKYEDLIYYVSYRISGDIAITSFEDNTQDLILTLFHAVEGFEKQNDGQNGKFEDFKDSKGFDSYVKTVLWNFKNKHGKNVTKKKKIHNEVISLSECEDVLEITRSDSSSIETSQYVNELSNLLPIKYKKAIRLILENPQLLFPSGKINIRAFSNKLGVSRYEGQKIVDELEVAIAQDFK